jgi:hypothetical protein
MFLNCRPGWLDSLETAGTPCAQRLGRVQEGRGTLPRSAESRATSQAVWIDVGDPAAGSVGTRLSGELAEQVLRGVKLPGLLLVVREFVKRPAANTVLFVGRKRRQLRDRGVPRAGHNRSIPNVTVSADVSPRAGSSGSDEQSPCPECLQNAGRTERNRGDASGRSRTANPLWFKRL